MPSALIIEDDSGVAEVLMEILATREIVAKIVDTGRDAIEHLTGREVDLVILDWNVPGMPTGPTLIREIRRLKPLATIVVCSGAMEAARDTGAAGANDYLPKPFAAEELLALLDEYL